MASQRRSGGVAGLPERFDDHKPLGFETRADGDHGQSLFQRRQLSHRSLVEGTGQRHQILGEHAP